MRSTKETQKKIGEKLKREASRLERKMGGCVLYESDHLERQ
jgi:hypothetical protein